MRRNLNLTLRTVTFLVGALFILTPLSFSETEIKVSGQVRVRTEVEKKIFVGLDTLINTWAEMRARLGVTVTIDSNITTFVQIQDSKVFGADGTSGTTTGSDNVDLHQAFIQIDELWKKGIGIKAGRFEFSLGNERIFGVTDWDSVGRSWEGVTAFYKISGLELTAFSLKKTAIKMTNNYKNNYINGLQIDMPRKKIQILFFYERDTLHQVTTHYNSMYGYFYNNYYDRDIRKFHVVMFNHFNVNKFNIEINGVYQFGETARFRYQPFEKEDIDISAFMFTFEAGANLDSLKNARIAGGIDYSSGDDNPDDNKIRYYDNLYYSWHKFRGYMDYFISSATYGLIDLYLKGKIDPIHGWTTACDIHYFTAAADYTDFRGERTKDIGAEIDFTVNTSRISGVGLQAGASIFFPTESYAARVSPRPGLWGYTMLTADF